MAPTGEALTKRWDDVGYGEHGYVFSACYTNVAAITTYYYITNYKLTRDLGFVGGHNRE